MQHEARWVVVTWFVLSELHATLGGWERRCTPFTRSFGPHPRGLCGSGIDDMLSFLCVDGYNGIRSRYRRHADTDTDTRSKLHGILIPREQANSYLVKRSAFYERGIVCECCYHHCNIMELFSYCRNGPSAFGIFKRSVDRQLKQNKLNLSNHSND